MNCTNYNKMTTTLFSRKFFLVTFTGKASKTSFFLTDFLGNGEHEFVFFFSSKNFFSCSFSRIEKKAVTLGPFFFHLHASEYEIKRKPKISKTAATTLRVGGTVRIPQLVARTGV